VVDRFSTSAALLAAALHRQPQVALVDLDLGGHDGARLVPLLTRAGVAVVVVTGADDPARWGECLRYGARAVLPKTGSLNDILAAIRRIAEGRAVVSSDERARLVSAYHAERDSVQRARVNLDRLSRREQAVLGQLVAGHTVREIAHSSYVAEATVRTQVKSILATLEVSSQIAAVGVAHSVRWRPPVEQR
jgi:DNA-binding NarL/FixJ family response regulator